MNIIQKIGLASCCTALLMPVNMVLAQTTNAPEASATIEEVLVTGRKRTESLTDVPVSISVFNAEALGEQGINSEDDLFAATPGLDYSNFNGSRQANNPGVRGVQSDLRASNQQKVTSFIDGMPMLGNSGSLQFSGVEGVEIYRGPQSAAFGRSTFAGAINYITADAAEEFEGKVLARGSDQGARELGVLVSGPITDALGYRISYVQNDWSGPDEWTATDGTEMGSEETEQFTAKFNFAFSDTAYGELSFSRLELFDQEGATWIADPASCDLDSGISYFSMGARALLPSDTFDCDWDVPGGNTPRNHDALGQFLGQYDANEVFYRDSVGMGFNALDTNMDGILQAEEYLAQTLPDGQTYEQAILGQTVRPGNTQDRDRIQGEMNFEIGDGLLQFMGMTTKDESFRWNENDYNDALVAFSVNMMTMQTSVAPNLMSMLVTVDIEETYGEVRWVSSEVESLRYTLSGSYYDYSLQQQVYNNGGALPLGWDLVYEGGPNAGQPVNPNSGITISEVATNVGASFGLQYDLSDRTTFSLEGRYQVDEVCGVDRNGANIESCKETKAFLPRIALNTTISDELSVYGQISIGNNPAGVNIAYQDSGNIQALQIASGQIAVPALAADGVTIPVNAGVVYDGAGANPPPVVDYDANTFPDFEEETLTNFEIGAKGNFANRRGSYTAAAYFMIYEGIIGAENLDWDDTDPGGWNEGNWNNFTGERTWINQGDGEMYGLEFTADYLLTDNWQVGGYITLSSSKYTDYCSIQAPNYRFGTGNADPQVFDILTPAADGVLSACGVADGNWIPKQTPFTANLNINHTLPNDLFGFRTSLRADVRHKGSYYEDHMNLIERDAVTTVNISANMRSDAWSLRLFVDNLTDVREPVRIFPANDYIAGADPSAAPTAAPSWALVPNRPREMGLQVQYEF